MSDHAAAPESIVCDKATEVALLAFSSEQIDPPAHPIDPPSAPDAGAPAAIFVQPDRAVSGTRFPQGRWAFAVIVCCVAIAAGAVFAPARVPAEPLSTAVSPPAINEGAVIKVSTAPTQSPSVPAAAELPQESSLPPAPVLSPAQAPAPATVLAPPSPVRTDGPTRREAAGRSQAAADIPAAQAAAPPTSPAVSTYSGSLAVSSSPEGAQVFVNGSAVGVTPLLLSNLAAGSRVVRLELPGHERWSSAVRVIAGEETRIDAPLRPLPPR